MIEPDTRLHPLTLQLLAWVTERPRTYGETMAAWRTHCPRLAIWEDALADDLVQTESGSGLAMSDMAVSLTARGRAALEKTPTGEVKPPS
jgi:hypothetical protein